METTRTLIACADRATRRTEVLGATPWPVSPNHQPLNYNTLRIILNVTRKEIVQSKPPACGRKALSVRSSPDRQTHEPRDTCPDDVLDGGKQAK